MGALNFLSTLWPSASSLGPRLPARPTRSSKAPWLRGIAGPPAAAMQHVAPVEWRPEVDQHLHRAFGLDWAQMKEVLTHLQPSLGAGYEVQQHPVINAGLTIRSTVQHHNIDYSICGGKEVVVTRKTGEAMMKGADLYAPGVLACSAGVSAGDLVAVSIALDEDGRLPFTRGTTLPADASSDPRASGRQLLGIGKAALGRIEMFRVPSGLAVAMQQRVYDSPPLNGVLPGSIMLQHLPSIVAAFALAPTPGSRVLDMCAAPGGKTTMLAQLMQDQGEVIAFDRTHVKAGEVRALAQEQGFTCIKAFKQDALKAVAVSAASAGGCQHAAAEAQLHTSSAGIGTAVGGVAQQADGALSTSDCASVLQTQLAAAASTSAAPAPAAAAAAAAAVGNQKVMQRQARKLAAMARHGHVPAARQQQQGPVCSGYPPATFDYVLLDAPCTATGLKPRLVQALDMAMLQRTATYQRQLLDVAVQLLKPGGSLVYSTCSITPDENECNVRYVLERYPEMKLVPQPCHIGGRGMTGPKGLGLGSDGHAHSAGEHQNAAATRNQEAPLSDWLAPDMAELVQRFDPRGPYIGFFCAKFCKHSGP